MDLEALKKRLSQRPERWETFGGREFLVRLPTRERMRDWFYQAGSVDGAVREAEFAKATSLIARGVVVGWRGVTLADLDHDGDAEAAPFDVDLLNHYLAERPNIISEIGIYAINWIQEVGKTEETERKNS